MRQNDTNMDDGTRHDHVHNNRAQNREFRNATQGLTHAQKEKVRREVEMMKKRGEDYNFNRIRELADEMKRRNK